MRASTEPIAECFYEAVAIELETQGVRKGLWAQAFAESGGDASRAKALYIQLRAAQLHVDHENEVRTGTETESRRLAMQIKLDRAEREAAEEALVDGGYPKALALAKRALAVALDGEAVKLQLESHGFADFVIGKVLGTLASPN